MKKMLTLCAVALISTAAFAGTKEEPAKETKKFGVYCEYTLNIYDSNGNFLTSEHTLSYQGSGSCGRFFKLMRSHYTAQGYELH